MMAGCRSARTLCGKEPGSPPRSTGASGVSDLSGMRLTVAPASYGSELTLQLCREREIAGPAGHRDQAADHEVPHLGHPAGLAHDGFVAAADDADADEEADQGVGRGLDVDVRMDVGLLGGAH